MSKVGLNVLSLFDGMSSGRIALERAGIKVNNYYASEVEKEPIKVSQSNWNDVVAIGDVTKVSYVDGVLKHEHGSNKAHSIDLLLAGSPCQSFSNLGNKEGFDGKSGLFWEFIRLLKETKPKFFLLENVRMKKEWQNIISETLGVKPIEINSKLVSAQSRTRLYWTNIPFGELWKSEITLESILDKTISVDSEMTPGRLRWLLSDKGQATVNKGYACIDPIIANCLTARADASWNCNYVTREGRLTKLSPEEYEKLQTVPVGYTVSVKASHRYKMLGNGWTVDVIVHILKGIVEPNVIKLEQSELFT
jgi:site-specific DNA-cytosine methylase